jgi:hypothetical protein
MSVYYDLLTGVQTSIATVTEIPISIRYDAILMQNDVVPLIIIAPDVEKVGIQAFPKIVNYDYKVNIAYITAGNRTVNTGLEAYLESVETIRNQLYQLNPTALPAAWNVKINPNFVSELQATVGTNYRVTGWQMTYTVTEQRNS